MRLDDLTPSNEAAKAAPMTASQADAAPLSASAASAGRSAQVASNSLLPFAATGDVSRLYDLIETLVAHQQEALTSSHRIIQDTLTAHLASRSMPRLAPAAIDIKQPADDLQKALNEQNLMQYWPCIYGALGVCTLAELRELTAEEVALELRASLPLLARKRLAKLCDSA
jgi:hypothetical protein